MSCLLRVNMSDGDGGGIGWDEEEVKEQGGENLKKIRCFNNLIQKISFVKTLSQNKRSYIPI